MSARALGWAMVAFFVAGVFVAIASVAGVVNALAVFSFAIFATVFLGAAITFICRGGKL